MQGDNENSNNQMDYNEFIERSFEEVEGGYYDGKGFYCTPEGSFWDENAVYFSREGRDRHGGFYDEGCLYIPGPGWVEELGCYQDEISPNLEDENIKANLYENIKDELVEDFNYYEKYFKNLEGEDYDEIDEEMAQKDEAEIFNEYVQKYFEGGAFEIQNNGLNANGNNIQYYCNPHPQNLENPEINKENYNRMNLIPNTTIPITASGQKISTVKFRMDSSNKSNLNFSDQGVNNFEQQDYNEN